MNQTSQSQSLHTYAEPLSGLRVSWGSILAGTLAMLGVALILWALALAIVLSATGPTVDAFRADAVALGICAIVTTLVGAFAGGMLSGFLPGNPRRAIGGVHGFLAWAVAFIAVSAMGGTVLGAGMMAPGRSIAALPGHEPSVATLVEERAVQALEGAGYTRMQAEEILHSNAESALQGRLDGRPAAQPNQPPGTPNTAITPNSAVTTWGAGVAWLWFLTWAVAGIIATLAGAAATRGSRNYDITDDFVVPRPRRFTTEPTPAVP